MLYAQCASVAEWGRLDFSKSHKGDQIALTVASFRWYRHSLDKANPNPLSVPGWNR
jgi:hypothetical protein